MEQPLEIDSIVIKYIREETLSAEETALLQNWLKGHEDREELILRLKRDRAWVQANLSRLQQTPTDPIWLQVEARLHAEGYWHTAEHETTDPSSLVPIIPTRVGSRRKYFVAAAIILIVSVGGGWLWRVSHRSAPPSPAVTTHLPADIRPGGNKAILTLTDGSEINLDSSANGVLANQGATKVTKLADGQLVYDLAKPSTFGTAIAYNSLTTPRAGQFTLTLPDGTHVWLNNASTLRYPVVFIGPDRSVELSGEAYFEVAKNVTHPFKVIVHRDATSNAGATPDAGGSIEVLGTSFNVMAYADEPAELTTLVEGSIRFLRTSTDPGVLLHPAEQSVLDEKGAVHILPHVDVSEVTAWKNGYFHFDRASLPSVMRQLARWYDIDVTYQGQLPEQQYMGKIQRNLPLSAVLKGLENEQVHFKLVGRRLTVLP